jgi:polar amino acid transport system substrate-binding protein
VAAAIERAEIKMQNFKTNIMACAAVLFLCSASAMADIKIGVAAEPYPPFTNKDTTGQWVGWEIDVANAVCVEIKEKCEIVETAWDGIIPALNAKKIDVIAASMAITPKRKEIINFSTPYYQSAAVMMGAKDGDVDISPAHLAGKTIGVQVSTIHAAYLEKYYAKTSTIKTYPTQDEANQDLSAGRVDYILANGLALDAFLKSAAEAVESKAAVPYDADVFGPGVGFGLRKDEAELTAKMSAAIATLAKAGTLEKISTKFGVLGKIELPK